jgi:uncharacterized protein (DUF2336 family)
MTHYLASTEIPPTPQSLILEMENTLSHGSSSQRSNILRRLTDLFLEGAEALPDERVIIFDDVMSYLIEKIERDALIELSGRLAPIDNAPTKVVGRLSRHDDIVISGPVLEQSKVLTDADLVEIAKTKSQDHLSAIAGREHISESVTDILIERGTSKIAQKVTANVGARFSQLGFTNVTRRAESDDDLAEVVANRKDLPPELFKRLVRRATEIVRRRLIENASPEMRERINEVLSAVSRQVARTEAERIRCMGAGTLMPKDPQRLKRRILTYAEARKTAELTEAFAVFCEVPVKTVKNLLRQGAVEGVLVLGKANGFGWPELLQILNAVMPAATQGPHKAEVLFEKFVMLSTQNAQRAVRFIKANTAVSRAVISKMI